MVDYARARRTMVDNQLRTSGITDWRILDVMNRVPREIFVPEALRAFAYSDENLAVSSGRSLLAPASFARIIQLAGIEPDDVVLDVGCGTGYSTAVIAGLASAVVAVDDNETNVAKANDTLASLDIGNAAVVVGSPAAGVAKEAPFDVIVIEGAVEAVPAALLDQLRDGGRLVAVLGQGNAATAHVFHRNGKDISARPAFNASLPPVIPFAQTPQFHF